MKKITFLLCLLPMVCFAQPGYINTIAGNGTTGFSGDGGAATSAQMGEAVSNVCFDGSGNVYIADYDNGRIRKVNSSGIISTFAGGGSSTADGILATSASLSAGAIAADSYGNIYLLDGSRVRKINAITGIISTIAGTGVAGYSGDRGPAIAAKLNSPAGICLDVNGNIYIGDESNHRVRKINTAGIISTYAGVGTAGFSGDNGPATAAQVSPAGLCIDGMGNLYVADRYNYRIRKIDASGTISTYAGSGSNGYCGDGGPATSACFAEPSFVSIDSYGNLYIADFHNQRVRKVNLSGIVSTFAGGGSSLNNGILATSASLSDTWGIGIDGDNNIFITDRYNYRIRKVNGVPGIPIATADSFSVYVNSLCSGPSITIKPAHYSASLRIKTWFGDGKIQTDTFSSFSGYSWLNHIYHSSGVYTIKHVLYKNSQAIDSIKYSYKYILCNTIPVQIYDDKNSNCIKDSSETTISKASVIEIDSNGVPIGTICATSGFYFTAFGAQGDVYAFKVISTPSGFHVTCPATGIVYDTIGATLSSPTKYIGVQCTTSTSFDLSVHATIPVTGVHDEWGNIYVENHYCMPINATLTLHYSPKYAGIPTQITPPATSVSGNTIVWNLSSLSSTLSGPVQLHYSIWKGSTNLTIADTVHSYFSISPIAGDADTTNNTEIIVDTVRAGCDPNEMWVTPACILSGLSPVQLQYKINFENTGNDTAHNIYVLDTLSDYLDASTMFIEMSSHEMYISKLRDSAGHNILKFDFPSINLLDSSHHSQCDGALIFNIKTKPGLPVGTNIFNSAGVYFDVNDVVMTNKVNDNVGCWPSSVNEEQIINNVKVYPNPINNQLTIEGAEPGTVLQICNIIGQQVYIGTVSSSKQIIDTKELSKGVYLLQLINKDGSKEVRKIVKE